MRMIKLVVACLAIPVALSAGCSSDSSGGTTRFRPEPYAANICIGDKQAAAGTFCETVMGAWAAYALDLNVTARGDAISAAGDALDTAWGDAENDAQTDDADCDSFALASGDAADSIEDAVNEIFNTITVGIDLGQAAQAQCVSDLMTATGDACTTILDAEGVYISDLHEDPDRSIVDGAIEDATNTWIQAWNTATASDCPTDATQEQVGSDFGALVDEVVSNTIVAPGVESASYISLVPEETVYKGTTFTPTCIEPGSEYRYFAKRGTVNKLVMYYQGGGACWDALTCGIPTCSPTATEADNPNSTTTGFADRNNENNPFKDWHTVFITYCTCDVHYGNATQEYTDELTIEHRGYHNSRIAEKWAREHFYDPEVVFVTGSSAGAYGAWFNGPLLHEVWPASQIHVLADAGNGVITQEFLTNEFGNWNFAANLPEYIPGVEDALDPEGGGMPAYTEAVAKYYPESNWAHYSTVYDGGQGGQTGFYNVMLTMSPLGAATWWQATCDFGDVARQQSADTFSAVPDNYRSYFGSGSAHTTWGRDKVYDDTTGGVPTVVDWLNAMLNSGPNGRDPDWRNVEATNPGLLLANDPEPPEPNTPPFQESNGDTIIVCE